MLWAEELTVKAHINISVYIRFEVLTAMSVKITMLRVVTPEVSEENINSIFRVEE
jgi:hypothetical protein